MAEADRVRWDEKYSQREAGDAPPDAWLVECVEGMQPGKALDVACGVGHNAIWLAERRWEVEGVDVSPVGLGIAAENARRRNVVVQWSQGDVEDAMWRLPRSEFDLVVVFRFLDRGRLPASIKECLAPGGMLIYETFVAGQLERADNHLRNPSFALQPGELLELYAGLKVMKYEEVELSDRSVARLMARRVE